MKKHLCLICLMAVFYVLPSCKTYTAVSVNTIEPYSVQQKSPKMDFLGFKNLSRYNELMVNFGEDLQKTQIAEDRTKFYLGRFDLQELSSYSGNHRYVSFVDVIRQNYTHSDIVDDNLDMKLAGWLIGSLTCFTLVPVYVPLLCCYKGNTTEVVLNAEYNLCVYDTEKKALVKSETISINQTERLNGRYSHKETDKKAVNLHYKTLLRNKLLEAFEKVYKEL
ncbi:MAG: hypothetical protein MJZ79_05550 [Paludibacteraceae bacterium]|nr:hypothetical protein [Paludibacteraceae bacterium]